MGSEHGPSGSGADAGPGRRIALTHHVDGRGALTAMELGAELPFPVHRAFLVHRVVDGAERGGHAHPDADQVAVAVAGGVTVRLETADGRVASHRLDDPTTGLHIPRATWIDLLDFTPGAVLLVLASVVYRPELVIRDRARFLGGSGSGRAGAGAP